MGEREGGRDRRTDGKKIERLRMRERERERERETGWAGWEATVRKYKEREKGLGGGPKPPVENTRAHSLKGS